MKFDGKINIFPRFIFSDSFYINKLLFLLPPLSLSLSLSLFCFTLPTVFAIMLLYRYSFFYHFYKNSRSKAPWENYFYPQILITCGPLLNILSNLAPKLANAKALLYNQINILGMVVLPSDIPVANSYN